MSIIGTGIDIVEISRIARVMDRTERFVSRVFTSSEIDYFNSRGNGPSHVAGAFAAKEAVLKALGTGLRGMEWKDIEIARDGNGRPDVNLYNGARTLAVGLGICKIHISISHERDYAVAQAVAEGDGQLENCSIGTDEEDR